MSTLQLFDPEAMAVNEPAGARMLNDNTAEFDRLEDIGEDAVEWLKSGSYTRYGRIYNKRTIIFTTGRGIKKGIRYYDGAKNPWHTSTGRRNSDRLTNEEARVFAPEIALKREERKRRDAEKLEKARGEFECIPVKIGDVFTACYGYDATLYEFHEVVRVSSSGKTVWTRQLVHETAPGEGPMSWKCRPRPGVYNDRKEEQRHTIAWKTWNKGLPSFTVHNDHTATLMRDVREWHDACNYH